MKKNSTLLIRINDELKEVIQDIARKNDVTVSEIINVCLVDIAKRGDLNLVQKGRLGILMPRNDTNELDILMIRNFVSVAIEKLKLQNKIKKVYLYGSFSRGENTPSSDIDLRLETSDDLSGFDIGNLRYEISNQSGREVDISNEDINKLDPSFYSSIKKDEICIYE